MFAIGPSKRRLLTQAIQPSVTTARRILSRLCGAGNAHGGGGLDGRDGQCDTFAAKNNFR